ncbi:hypothetical protein A6R68_01526, partial [Neotoma lepida]
MGALLQRKSEVQVAYMGNFMDTDQRKTVSQGHAAILNLVPIISCPRPQVTWFREGHKIIPSSRIWPGSVTEGYLVNTSRSDCGLYLEADTLSNTLIYFSEHGFVQLRHGGDSPRPPRNVCLLATSGAASWLVGPLPDAATGPYSSLVPYHRFHFLHSSGSTPSTTHTSSYLDSWPMCGLCSSLALGHTLLNPPLQSPPNAAPPQRGSRPLPWQYREK